MAQAASWSVSGTYFEVCNCEAICPCRRVGDAGGGKSTYDTCDFALSWRVKKGNFDALDLVGQTAVLVGRWDNAEPTIPGFPPFRPPWHVTLYVDEQASEAQRKALSDIFLGRAGGGTWKKYARAIGEVVAVRPARIELDHTPNHERMWVERFVSAMTGRRVPSELRITCGIPGHDRPGQEVIAEHMRVNDQPFEWELRGRCGFATDFAYSSQE